MVEVEPIHRLIKTSTNLLGFGELPGGESLLRGRLMTNNPRIAPILLYCYARILASLMPSRAWGVTSS